jgi:tetratricopeptide (TPR) repeat protein
VYLNETANYLKIYGKYLCGFLEANICFINNQLQDCLNKLATPTPQGISTNFADFFALNAAGCVHLKMNKPSLALLYYNKAIQKSKDLTDELAADWGKDLKRAEQTSVHSKTSKVLLNCALSHYKQGYFANAWKLFEKISNDNINNFLFWYRFGTCGLNWFLQECENRSKKVPANHEGKERVGRTKQRRART